MSVADRATERVTSVRRMGASANVALTAAPASTMIQQRWTHSRKTGSAASAPYTTSYVDTFATYHAKAYFAASSASAAAAPPIAAGRMRTGRAGTTL